MKKFRLTGSSWDVEIGTVVTAYPHDYVGQTLYTIFEPHHLRAAIIDQDHIMFPIPHDFSAEEIPNGDDA